MGKIQLSNLSIKITPVKAIKKHSSTKITTILVKGLVIEKDGVYKCSTKLDNKDIILDFTGKSFDLHNRLSIFSKIKDKTNHYLRIIRTKEQAAASNGISELYVPFRPNWIVNGYIIKENDTLKFDFNNLVAIQGHEYDNGIDF